MGDSPIVAWKDLPCLSDSDEQEVKMKNIEAEDSGRFEKAAGSKETSEMK